MNVLVEKFVKFYRRKPDKNNNTNVFVSFIEKHLNINDCLDLISFDGIPLSVALNWIDFYVKFSREHLVCVIGLRALGYDKILVFNCLEVRFKFFVTQPDIVPFPTIRVYQ